MDGSIALEMTFDAGHRIVGHKGKCACLHGHTYRVKILMNGEVKEPGFVVDFGLVKGVVNLWDHKLLLWESDTCMDHLDSVEDSILGVIRLPFNPTAENMAHDLARGIQSAFDLDYVHVTLWETPNACAKAQAVRQ